MTVCASQATGKRSELPAHVSFHPTGQSLSSTGTTIKKGQKSECQGEQRSLEKGCGNGKRDAHLLIEARKTKLCFRRKKVS